MEKMRGHDKMEVHLHGRHCRGDRKLLEDIQNSWVIGLDDNAGFGGLNQMSHLFNHLYKICNLEFHRLVILLNGGDEPRKKEKWLDRAAARPTALRQIFINGGMKNNRSESKLFRDI